MDPVVTDLERDAARAMTNLSLNESRRELGSSRSSLGSSAGENQANYHQLISSTLTEGSPVIVRSDSRQLRAEDDLGIKRVTQVDIDHFREDLNSSRSGSITLTEDNQLSSEPRPSNTSLRSRSASATPISDAETAQHQQRYYVCPSNTIVASNGDVYHVEPFQLPPPAEIASLFAELKKYRRLRGDSNLSDSDPRIKDGGSGRVPRTATPFKPASKSDLAYGAHERPGSSTRRRFSLEVNSEGRKSLPPPSKTWTAGREPTIPEIDEGRESLRRRSLSPLTVLVSQSQDQPQNGENYGNDTSVETESLDAKSTHRDSLFQPNILEPDDCKIDLRNFSFLNYFHAEIFGVGEPGHLEPDAISNIINFLDVPFKVEELIVFGFFVCLDSFLFVLTFLPIRVICSIFTLFYDIISTLHHKIRGILTSERSFHRTHAYDLMRGALLLLGVYVLHLLNMSRVYHFIRGQTMIKLYVLTGMLEIFDKLLCTFGQDALDSLYWQTCMQPDLLRVAFSFIVVCAYVIVHSCVYFFHVATLTVAFNSDDQALITVLILNNFSEMKGFVFKKFDKQQLFQLACSDITERFILTLFFSSVVLVAFAQAGSAWMKLIPNAAYVIFLMVGGEAIADWIKHGTYLRYIICFFRHYPLFVGV